MKLYYFSILLALLAISILLAAFFKNQSRKTFKIISGIFLFASFLAWVYAVYNQFSDYQDSKAADSELPFKSLDPAFGYLLCIVAYFIPYIRKVVISSENSKVKFTISGWATILLAVLGALPSLIPYFHSRSGYISILLQSLTVLSTILALGGETYKKEDKNGHEVWRVTSLGKVLVLVLCSSLFLNVAELKIRESQDDEALKRSVETLKRIEKVDKIVTTFEGRIQKLNDNLTPQFQEIMSNVGKLDSSVKFELEKINGDFETHLTPLKTLVTYSKRSREITDSIKTKILRDNLNLRREYMAILENKNGLEKRLTRQITEQKSGYENTLKQLATEKDSIINAREFQLSEALAQVKTLETELNGALSQIDLQNALSELTNQIDSLKVGNKSSLSTSNTSRNDSDTLNTRSFTSDSEIIKADVGGGQ